MRLIVLAAVVLSSMAFAQDSDGAADAGDVADTALKKKCGNDFHKMRVGQAFTRARECSGLTFEIKIADAAFKVYSASDDTGATGTVRVEAGKITRIVYPP